MTKRTLIGIGIAMVATVAWTRLWMSSPLEGSFFGGDLEAYTTAAQRLVSTGSPYSNEVMSGPVANVRANVPIGYFYPPPLAQLFVPLADIPIAQLGVVWALLQVAAATVVFPGLLLTRGMRHSTVAFAVLASQPFQLALHGGNLSGWIAIAVGALLVTSPQLSGGLSAVMAAIKFSPGPYLGPALALRASRGSAVVTLAAVFAASLVLSPRGWTDWVTALPNILRNEMSMSGSNYSPAYALAVAGLPTAAGFVQLMIAVAFGIWAIVTAMQDGEFTLRVVTCATASYVFASSTLWDHYLAVLVPLALFAWFRVGRVRRLILWATFCLMEGMWFDFGQLDPYRVLISLAVICFFVALATHREDRLAEGHSRSMTVVAPPTATWLGQPPN